MIVTESEAKTKACPFFDKKCEASECMAWGWYSEVKHSGSGLQALPPVPVKTNKGSCKRA